MPATESSTVDGTGAPEAAIDASAADLALKTQMENGLSGSVVFEGEPVEVFTLSERMAKFNVPALSIAYAKDGEIVWAEAYGEGVDTDTLFQAASMSKVVAATGIAAYALSNDISLDENIDGLVPGIDLTAISPEGTTVSLRSLLSHTAGATVGGFPGYAVGETMPTNLEVVLGSDDTNTDAVIIEPNPDKEFRYSGGGFQIAQAVIEAQSNQPFETVMSDYVLNPVGMTASSFELKAPGGPVDGIATATNGDGSPVDGGWHVYPEQAAAGLWTNPTEYTDFVFALMDEAEPASRLGIAEDVASEVLTPVSEAYGLGIGIEDMDGRIRLRHGGSNRGYRCFFMAFPDTQEVFVLMTNSANGSQLGDEVIRSAAATYGWPGAEAKTVTRFTLDDSQLAQFSGSYALPGSTDAYASLTVGDGALAGEIATGGSFTLVPLSETEFIDPDDGQEISFREDGDDMLLQAGGTVLTRLTGE